MMSSSNGYTSLWLNAILLPSRRVVVSYNRKYVHEVLFNCSYKLVQKKSVVKWTDRPTWP